MSTPQRFDPQRLAARGDTLAGEFDTGMMPRLSEVLARAEPAPVHFEVSARRDEARRLVVTGSARATLQCVCQRCMEPVALAIDAEFSLAVVADEDAARHLPAELDPLLLESGAEVNLPALLEDELMLALPPVPVHAEAGECGERARYVGTAPENEFDSGEERQNPFAVLKKLKNEKPD